MPLIIAPATAPASSGSSPAYSKLRPLRGSRVRLTPGPSNTLKPFARASAPIMAPARSASATSNVAAMARPDGNGVAFLERRDAEPGDARDVAGRTDGAV